MRKLSSVLLIPLLCLGMTTLLKAQVGFEVRLTQAFRVGGKLDVDVEIRSTASSFVLATSGFMFDYNAAGLASPTKVSANDGPWDNTDADYQNVYLNSGPGYAGLTVIFVGGDDNNGAVVPSTFTRVGTVRLTILDPSQSSGLTWRTEVNDVFEVTNPGVGGQDLITSYGTFIDPINTPLLNIGFEVRLTQAFRVGGKLDVDVEIRNTVSSFVLATSTFVFNYNTAGLGSPTKVVANDGPWDNPDADYQNVSLSSGTGYAGLTVVFLGGDDNNGAVVPSTFTRVGTVQLTILDPNQSSDLTWKSIGTATEVAKVTNPGVGGQDLITQYGTFIDPISTPLLNIGFEVRLTQAFRVGGKLDVDVEIRNTASSFVLATSTFVFNYNTAGLGGPTKVVANDGPWDNPDADYQNVSLSSGTGYAGLIVVFLGGDDNNGAVVPSTFTRVGTVRLTILDPNQSSGLTWKSIGTATEVAKVTNPGVGGQDLITPYGTFIDPINTPLLNIGFEVRLTQAFRVGGKLDVDVEIRSTASSFVLATSTFVFNYNMAGLGSPTKVAANDGPWDNSDADYQNVSLVSGMGYAGLIVAFMGGDDNNGTVVPSTFTRVGTVQLTILDPSQSSGLTWRGIALVTEVLEVTNPGVGGQDLITPYGTFIDPINTQLFARTSIKVFLEGPFSGGSMSTALNGVMPTTQPYSTSPWNYPGTENVSSIPSGVVDWVLVQLRTDQTSTVATRAAFLKSDGSIIDIDGTSGVAFPSLSAGNYYIVIRHRNHLAVMSAASVALDATSSLYDFTDWTGGQKAFGNSIAMKNLGGGVYGMYAGNSDGNNVINVFDYNAVGSSLFQSGYRKGDHNMNGIVNVFDYNPVGLNIFKTSQVP